MDEGDQLKPEDLRRVQGIKVWLTLDTRSRSRPRVSREVCIYFTGWKPFPLGF
jgi:hypothetical protein